MITIREIKGNPLVFNLNNGKSLRLYARQSVDISDALAESAEIVSAEKNGLITLTESPEVKKTTNNKKEVKSK